MRHLGVCEGDELEVQLFAGEALLPWEYEGLTLGLWVETILVEAPHP
jgi:hypothetical protein